MNNTNKIILIFLGTLLFIWGCERWEEHISTKPGVAEENIMELINSNPNLSEYAALLESTGWDEDLILSRSYTVWAPNNAAMDLMDESILSDTAALADFVSNHICFGNYSYYTTQEIQKVKSYSGKHLLIDNANARIEDASLLEPYDIPANNGTLHIIDKPLNPKPNIWEIIETTDLCQNHTEYLNSMSGLVFDPSVADIIGVNPINGQPIYDTLSGMVWNNSFLTEVRDLTDEDMLSTMILIEDAVFDSEFDKFRDFFVLNDSVESDDLTKWQISRDLVFPGQLELEEIPDTLISLFNTKIPFNKNAVETTFETSNGVVYILSDCDVSKEDKIPTLFVEGEDTTKFVFTAVDGQSGFTRQHPLASGGYDFLLDNHRANPGYINYYLGNVAAGKYKIVWKAVNDFNGSYRNPNPDLILQQRLYKTGVAGYNGLNIIWEDPVPISPEMIPVNDSTYETAGEVEVGTKTFYTYQELWLQIQGGGNNMTITLDYMKVIPLFE